MSLPVTMWREVERSSWLLCSQVPRKQELNKYEVKARAEILSLRLGTTSILAFYLFSWPWQ